MAKRILLVDDEPCTVLALKLNLQRHNYDVACAEDGQEAWTAIERYKPDLIVTDFRMPKMNGLELAALVRTNATTAGVPIILFTSKGFEISEHDLRRQFSIEAVVPKPFNPREFHRLADRLLADVDAPFVTL
jgi:DNA-binding response OmpR family regulator